MSSTVSATDILRDAYERIHEELPELLGGLDSATLLWRPDPDANSIAWLAWHLTRVQDDHVAGVGEVEQVWTRDGFAGRFALPYAVETIGYGHTSAEVGAFDVADARLLVDYHDAVHVMTMGVVETMDDSGFARVVDEDWDPPVTAAVRLVSVIGDALAHLGQIGYVRGLAERRAGA
ncbi:MAG: DinB family protein [Dermatophilaceae bacterium]|nr:DinB family protein [Intrasporangiaceae bacterium]